MRFDAEDLILSLYSFVSTRLNPKIAEIEAEKASKGSGLSPPLSGINDHYFQTVDQDQINNSPIALLYGIQDVQVISAIAGATVKNYVSFFSIIMVDDGNFNDINYRMLRYMRALEEIFNDFSAQSNSYAKIKIETLAPSSFKLDVDSSVENKICGVAISMALD